MDTDLRAVVECLFAASYTEAEIIEYLEGTLGVALQDAVNAVNAAGGRRSSI